MSARPPRSETENVADNAEKLRARRQMLADYLCFRMSELVPGSVPNRPRGGMVPDRPAPAPRYASPAEAQAAAIERAVKSLRMARRASQVLTQLLNGASEKQIALSLSISKHTVHTYVKQLHARLNVASRGELLSLFVGTSDDTNLPKLR